MREWAAWGWGAVVAAGLALLTAVGCDVAGAVPTHEVGGIGLGVVLSLVVLGMCE